MSTDLELKVRKSFLKLNKILTTKKIPLVETYDAYDTDKNGELTITEFERILKRLDTSFTSE
jgi:Ca2+-binding EF-hand superfamily protein